MFQRTIGPDDLARLKREREDADRRYNEALTALDHAIQQASDLPDPPPLPDEYQVGQLNRLWNLLPANQPDFGSGWRARLKRFVWAIAAPAFQQQQEFNGALVDHFNRNVEIARETAQAIDAMLAVLTARLEALITFESRLVMFAQQITPYADTKDREVSGIFRRVAEDNAEHVDRLESRTIGLAAGIGGVSDEVQKRWESMVARERRYEAQVHEVRTTLSTMQQSSLTLKRELERLMTSEPRAGAPKKQRHASGSQPAVTGTGAVSSPLDSYKYVGFEDQFRGSTEQIRSRLADYLPLFDGASDVLDVGCGRGEFLDLLRERGIGGRGLDINHEMVEVCRGRGLEADEGDALGYLSALPDASLGGVFAAQVVEHLEPEYLIRLLDTAYHKARPGSKIVLETINPACWYAFFESYIRDITHVRPLHPDTLRYLILASGFQKVELRYREPFPEESKLQPIAARPSTGEATPSTELLAFVSAFNENVTKLNQLLFTHLDYVVIGERI